MWQLVFYKHKFAIYRNEINGSYKVVVDGHKKFDRHAFQLREAIGAC